MRQLMISVDTSAHNGLGAGLTALFLTCFVGWAWWAYAPANRASHEAASRMPLDGGE